MDGRLIGLVGGIVGGVVGLMGGIVGTYISITKTSGPKELAFAIRAAAFCWIGVLAFLACLFLLPQFWRSLPWIVYLPLLFLFIRWANDRQARAKLDDLKENDLGAARADGL